MWLILMLLWLLPIALAIIVAKRLSDGAPAVSKEEWRLFFGDTKEIKLSFWRAVTFAVFAVLFFIVGVFEGLTLVNLGPVLLVIVPLLTGLVAMLLIVLWLRSRARAKQIPYRITAPSRAHGSPNRGIWSPR